MEEKAEVLEDNTHGPSQGVNFVVRNTEGISAVDNDLSLSGKDFSVNNAEKSGLS